MKADSKVCASSHFRTYTLVNNMSEPFYSYMLEARDKPIVSMLEVIQRKVMTQIQTKRLGMEMYEGILCRLIAADIEKAKKSRGNCFPTWSGGMQYKVDCSGRCFLVDLAKRTCLC